MWLYLLIFVFVLFFYFETTNKPKNNAILASIMILLAFFVGISDMLGGYDRYIYAEIFDLIADMKGDYRKNGAFDFFWGEYGWTYLNIFFSHFTRNRYIFILIITLLTYSLLFISFKRYFKNYALGLLFFLGLWFFFSFTYLRQVLGASIAWLSIPYILKRDLKRFLLIIFVAYTIHNSAIVLIPLYFIPIKIFKKQTVIYLLIVAMILGLSGLPSGIFDAYASISDATMMRTGHNKLSETQGARFAYFAEVVIFMFFILKNYHKFANNKKTILLLNMSLAFCYILLLFIRSDNGGRMSWYFMIGLFSTLTTICNMKGNYQYKSMLIAISFALYIRLILSWGSLLFPYKTFFTNGFREVDYIHREYEYDSNYDKDKFYR